MGISYLHKSIWIFEQIMQNAKVKRDIQRLQHFFVFYSPHWINNTQDFQIRIASVLNILFCIWRDINSLTRMNFRGFFINMDYALAIQDIIYLCRCFQLMWQRGFSWLYNRMGHTIANIQNFVLLCGMQKFAEDCIIYRFKIFTVLYIFYKHN